MKSLMIDIETMGTHTSESLILSVGAITFTMHKDGPSFLESFLKVLTWEPQVISGRRIEPGTQKWWSEQTPQARRHWTDGDKIHPAYLRDELLNFYNVTNLEVRSDVWANGIVFDIGNLENLFHTYEKPIPWEYNAVRDARTIYQMPRLRQADPEIMAGFIGHDPIEDCKKQIWRLWEHLPSEFLEPSP